MELKVWVEGVVRVVSGLSLSTSCEDVVIALAQSIGQTGRYVLILKLRGVERQLVADDCPLQHLAQLGQLAADVQFVLRRTGPSLSDGQATPTANRFPVARAPEAVKRRAPHKALSFSLGPSAPPRRTAASGEPLKAPPTEDAFRQVLQQQRRLQDLEVQIQALERESKPRALDLAPPPGGLLEELEAQLRHNQVDLLQAHRWEEQLQEEAERERDMQRRLQQLQSSVDGHTCRIQELQTLSAQLEQEVQVQVQRLSSRTLRPLQQELVHRQQQAQHLDASLSETQREVRSAEEKLQGRWETIEELNKELRQCKLQHFIQQTGGAPDQLIRPPDQLIRPPDQLIRPSEVYLSSASIVE